MDKVIKNNQVTIIGEIVSPFTFSHEVFGEGFYMVYISTKRISGNVDAIPVTISERLIDVSKDYTGELLMVSGQFRSYNKWENQRSRLILSVFAREAEFIEEEPDGTKTNNIFLDGYICKPPVYRQTPGAREITDIFMAVNRPYGKTDYIPCICWGRNAVFASSFGLGTRIAIDGRIQSRIYDKKLDDGDVEKRTAYEVSVFRLEVLEESNDALRRFGRSFYGE